mmetsp:Transcript_59483/g.141421  ORF Transcript_59483/g.141421 Transcript_59483/m.141421 type:complete len:147 (+) Transcript_59483:235-675(+)
MVSALRIVLSLCATTTVVRQCDARSLSMAACTNPSDSASRAEVASSRRRILGSLTSARAIAIRCFCPPDSRTPRSPTAVSSPSSKDWMKSQAFALLAAAITLASISAGERSLLPAVERSTPTRMFSRIDRANSTGSCMTLAILRMK